VATNDTAPALRGRHPHFFAENTRAQGKAPAKHPQSGKYPENSGKAPELESTRKAPQIPTLKKKDIIITVHIMSGDTPLPAEAVQRRWRCQTWSPSPLGPGASEKEQGAVLVVPKGYYFHDRPNSLPLVVEIVLFIS
jgi:hypothetical protein